MNNELFYNVADQITSIALKYPNKKAVVMPHKKYFSLSYNYEYLTFSQLEENINKLSNRFVGMGIKSGDRVLLFVKPSIFFSAYTFALFKIGAIPIFIDPGMGVKNFLNAVSQVKADVLLGVPKAHFLSYVFKKKFKNISLRLTTKCFTFGAKSTVRNLKKESSHFNSKVMSKDDIAAILFTSGGTGVPKGVIYTHNIFIKQTEMLKGEFSLSSNDVDIPGFPLFALFTLAMGMTSCIPDMNPTRPSCANPKKLLKIIQDQKGTFVAGSPAIWKKLLDYCLEKKITLPSVKYLVMFGAPIPVDLHAGFEKVLPYGTTYTPYGATECLPVTNISGREVLNETKNLTLNGAGVCVGKALLEVEVRVIKESSDIINESMIKPLEEFEVGEIIVSSPASTPGYFHMDDKTKMAKIYEGDKLWHRMGDMGYFDDGGRLWFCGRQRHSFEYENQSFYPIPVETIFNKSEKIKKSALVCKEGVGPVLIIEKSNLNKSISKVELFEIAKSHKKTELIQDFYFYGQLPVDVRHNIKIDRIALSKWVNSTEHKSNKKVVSL